MNLDRCYIHTKESDAQEHEHCFGDIRLKKGADRWQGDAYYNEGRKRPRTLPAEPGENCRGSIRTTHSKTPLIIAGWAGC